jgi:hypothetical protein
MDDAQSDPFLPAELLLEIMRVLAFAGCDRQGFKKTLLELMLSCRNTFELGLPLLLRELKFDPRLP